MNKIKLWMIAAILICDMTMVSCFSDTKKSKAVTATDDASQFVTITDVVPDVILTSTKAYSFLRNTSV